MKYLIALAIAFSAIATSKLTTFNTGLAHTYVPQAKQRLPHIINALKEKQSDVICLQEVWKKSDRKKIMKELAHIYPFSHYTKIKQQKASKAPVCKIKEIFGKGKFVTCTQKQCKGRSGDDFTGCVINRCQDSLVQLKNKNRQCAAALMSQVGKSAIASILAVITPFKRASMFTYKGANGLLLLSKKKLSEKKVLDFSDIASLSRRQALNSKVDGVGEVYCTHLTSDLDKDVPYAGKFDSWSQENLEQAKRLSEAVLGSTSDRVYVMGDINAGLDYPSKDIESDLPVSYRTLSNGLDNHFAENNPECSFCLNNPLTDESSSKLIDHILTRGVNVISSEREFDWPIELDGRKSHLSDHFGISITVE